MRSAVSVLSIPGAVGSESNDATLQTRGDWALRASVITLPLWWPEPHWCVMTWGGQSYPQLPHLSRATPTHDYTQLLLPVTDKLTFIIIIDLNTFWTKLTFHFVRYGWVHVSRSYCELINYSSSLKRKLFKLISYSAKKRSRSLLLDDMLGRA